MKKTREQVLNQDYMSPTDLKIIMPTMGIERCRSYIKEVREEMDLKGLFVPKTTPILALTKLVRKKFGF